jgi:hypothetical protein
MRRVLGEDAKETMMARFEVAARPERAAPPARGRRAAEKIAIRDRERLPEDNPDRALALYNWPPSCRTPATTRRP